MQVQPTLGIDHDIHDAGRFHPVGDHGVNPRNGLQDFGGRWFSEYQAPVDNFRVRVVNTMAQGDGVIRVSGISDRWVLRRGEEEVCIQELEAEDGGA